MAAVAEHVLDFDFKDDRAARKVALENVIFTLDSVLANGALVADKSDFGQLFEGVVSLLEMRDEELATLLMVSRPTIGRWKRGEAAPHPIARSSVFEALRRVARKKMP